MMEKLVRKWSKKFGLTVRDEFTNIKWEEKLNAAKLIDEEYIELTTALSEDDNPNIVEEAVDLIWVTIRLLQIMGVDAEEALKIKFDANMTKGFENIKEVTEEAIAKDCVVANPSRGFYVMKNRTTGKVVKPDHYKKPDFKTNYPN